ncbi:MAG: hypothetical protein R3E39_25875 [Anaerolineae bacterium]
MRFTKRLSIVAIILLAMPPVLLAQSPAQPSPTAFATPTLPLIGPTPLSAEPIKIGETVNGRFSDANAMVTYRFVGQAGQIITIALQNSLISGAAGCFTLGDTSLVPLAYSTTEYLQSGPRAALYFFPLPGDQDYFISISACGASGDYSLSLAAPPVGLLDFNHFVEGHLSDAIYAVGYRFEGRAGDLLTFSFSSLISSITVDLVCAEKVRCGEYVVNSVTGYNASGKPQTLPADALYLVTVRSQGEVGSFRLAVNRLTSTPVAYNVPVEAEFNDGVAALQYTFPVAMGDNFNVRATSAESFDTRLTLMTADGNLLTQDDDSGNRYDPEILNQLVYSSGNYMIILEPAMLGNTGTVSILLERIPPVVLDDGPQQLILTSKQVTGVARFSGAAGEQVRVHVRVIAGLTASPQLDIRQNATLLVNSFASGSDGFAVDFVTPETGDVIIFVTGGTGTVELSLERLGQVG